MLDSNLLLVLAIGALLVANGLIARGAAAKQGEATEPLADDASTSKPPSA